MIFLSRFSGFVSSDGEYAPFGIAPLRGLTAWRLASVLALCVIYTLHSVSVKFAVGFTAASAYGLVIKLAMICVSVLPFLVLVTIVDNITSRRDARARAIFLALAVIAGAFCSGLIEASLYRTILNSPSRGAEALTEAYATYISTVPGRRPFDFLFAPLGIFWGVPFNVWTGFSMHWLAYGALLTAVYYFLVRERVANAALYQSRISRQSLDRQMTEARLQMLQAQIEPHFLFNTLATIKRLYLVNPGQGKAMLRDLTDYLRAALPQMRESGSTLKRELALTRAYLNVQQVRMGARLKVEIAAPQELLAASLPPMMLPTLVENAIKHGLNPLPQGGTLRIRAERDGERLRVVVADNGAGFHQAAGPGVGLANTRERLATLYGAEGRLQFDGNSEGGITAAIELPYQVVQPDVVTP
jgi:hypothetical protein